MFYLLIAEFGQFVTIREKSPQQNQNHIKPESFNFPSLVTSFCKSSVSRQKTFVFLNDWSKKLGFLQTFSPFSFTDDKSGSPEFLYWRRGGEGRRLWSVWKKYKEMTVILLAQLLVTSSFIPRDFSAFSQPFFLINILILNAHRNFSFFTSHPWHIAGNAAHWLQHHYRSI